MKTSHKDGSIDISHTSREGARERVLLCVNAALKRKPHNLVVLRVSELTSFTDYFIICSGNSDRQVQAITDAIREGLKEDHILPVGVEGEKAGQWVLMDYGDMVVHVFYEPLREFYDIEGLWSEAPVMEVDEAVRHISKLDDEL